MQIRFFRAWRRVVAVFACCVAVAAIAEAVDSDSSHAVNPRSAGDGFVARETLTAAVLQDGSGLDEPVSMSAFAMPEHAKAPRHHFAGRLKLLGGPASTSFRLLKDTYDLANEGLRRHLPEFDYQFVQDGNHLVPVKRGVLRNIHLSWEYILEPGRVWQEPDDGDFSRASLPFSLQERNENCTHNGVLSFLFKGDGSVSRVAYQISSETCKYFQFDMWGLADASYQPGEVDGAEQLIAAYRDERDGRMPVKLIAELAVDYAHTNVSQFGSKLEISPDHMTVFGYVIDGVNYVGGCETRHGPYPYCEVLNLPSYSLAKSVFAGLALMALERQFPGTRNELIADHVPECVASGNWGDVSFENVLDMASGNFRSSEPNEDEEAAPVQEEFFLQDHAGKIAYACNHFPRQATPGTRWVYRTSDTYILGVAMNHFYKQKFGQDKDIYADLIVEQIWKPLGLSPVTWTSKRTYDDIAQPFTGYGLTFHHDDVAKLSTFLNVDGGILNSGPIFDETMFATAMQRDSNARGLQAEDANLVYQHGLRAWNAGPRLGCKQDAWIPFLAGYGYIRVAMMPNNSSYYFFSDNNELKWARAARESNRIRPFCR